jgi:hypothetical protein
MFCFFFITFKFFNDFYSAEIEPRAWHRLGRCSTTKLHPQPLTSVLFFCFLLENIWSNWRRTYLRICTK